MRNHKRKAEKTSLPEKNKSIKKQKLKNHARTLSQEDKEQSDKTIKKLCFEAKKFSEDLIKKNKGYGNKEAELNSFIKKIALLLNKSIKKIPVKQLTTITLHQVDIAKTMTNDAKNSILQDWSELSFQLSDTEIENFPDQILNWLKSILCFKIFTRELSQIDLKNFTILDQDSKININPLLFLPTHAMCCSAGSFSKDNEKKKELFKFDSPLRVIAALKSISRISPKKLTNLSIFRQVNYKAVEQAICDVHGRDFFEFLKTRAQLSEKIGIVLGLDNNGDTLWNALSLQSVYDSIGQELFALEKLISVQGPGIALGISRPPGHHTDQKIHGFCPVNKVAIAAEWLIKRDKRVLIVDIDAHYGDGTINWIKRKQFNQVMMVNLFNQKIFPAMEKEKIQEDNQFLNIKNLQQISFKDYNRKEKKTSQNDKILKDISKEIQSANETFHPDFILVSFGLDGHQDDPLGKLGLKDEFYIDTLEQLVNLSTSLKKIPILIVLEGGYNLSVIERITHQVTLKLEEWNHKIIRSQTHQKQIDKMPEKNDFSFSIWREENRKSSNQETKLKVNRIESKQRSPLPLTHPSNKNLNQVVELSPSFRILEAKLKKREEDDRRRRDQKRKELQEKAISSWTWNTPS